MVDFKAILSKTKKEMDAAMQHVFLRDNNTLEKTSGAMNYILNLGDGGKRMRPAIVMTITKLFNGDEEKGKQFAEAVELIHSYTLIIDDIQDEGKVRRNEPTCHIKYGFNTAILAASRLFERGSAPFHQNCAEEFRLLNDQLHQGQAADLNTQKWTKNQLTLNDLQFIHAGKTSSLIQMSILGGCIASQLNDSDTKKLLQYGYYLGLAFQAKDDILSKLQVGESGKESTENTANFPDFFANTELALNAAIDISEQAKKKLQGFSNEQIQVLSEIADYAVNRMK